MKWAIAPLALLALSLSACATPEKRLRTGLMDAGLSRAVATCMADRMAERLSLLQLRRLDSLAGLRDKNAGDLTLNQFLHRVRALKDAEILTVTVGSAAICSFD